MDLPPYEIDVQGGFMGALFLQQNSHLNVGRSMVGKIVLECCQGAAGVVDVVDDENVFIFYLFGVDPFDLYCACRRRSLIAGRDTIINLRLVSQAFQQIVSETAGAFHYDGILDVFDPWPVVVGDLRRSASRVCLMSVCETTTFCVSIPMDLFGVVGDQAMDVAIG